MRPASQPTSPPRAPRLLGVVPWGKGERGIASLWRLSFLLRYRDSTPPGRQRSASGGEPPRKAAISKRDKTLCPQKLPNAERISYPHCLEAQQDALPSSRGARRRLPSGVTSAISSSAPPSHLPLPFPAGKDPNPLPAPARPGRGAGGPRCALEPRAAPQRRAEITSRPPPRRPRSPAPPQPPPPPPGRSAPPGQFRIEPREPRGGTGGRREAGQGGAEPHTGRGGAAGAARSRAQPRGGAREGAEGRLRGRAGRAEEGRRPQNAGLGAPTGSPQVKARSRRGPGLPASRGWDKIEVELQGFLPSAHTLHHHLPLTANEQNPKRNH